MKSYRFFGDEAEILGNRLDQARECVKKAKTKWSKMYWQQNVDRLLWQWRQLPILHDGDAQVTIIPKWTVSYDFYERAEFTGHGITDRLYYKFFETSANLDHSWEAHREKRLARAQY